jgi:hypothetical protein
MTFCWTKPSFAALGLVLSACLDLEAPRAIGPVVRLTATNETVEGSPGAATSVSVQALDVNGVGVSGAWVTFARFDANRVTWPDAPSGSDAITVQTRRMTVANVDSEGLATAALKIPDTAPPGDAVVFAVVKAPADDAATVTAKISLHVIEGDMPSGGTGGQGAEQEDQHAGGGQGP